MSSAGAAGELRGKRLEELQELLERQEKILSNKKFIARLPDRGKKIVDFTEKVQAAIAEHRRVKQTTDLFSAFKLEFQQKQNTVKEKNLIEVLSSERDVSRLPTETGQNDSSDNTAHFSTLETIATIDANSQSLPGAALCNIQHRPKEEPSTMGTESLSLPRNNMSVLGDKCNMDSSSRLLADNTIAKAGKADTDLSGNTADDLVNSLKMISIKDSTEEGNDTPEPSNQRANPITTKSHFLEVIERRAKNPFCRKEKFKTNRLPPESNSSSPNQSPGEGVLRLSAEERRAQDRKHLDDITAARLPPLHHSPAQLIPLEESLTLQIDYKKSYEEKQAKLAAQKLFEKLNVKVGPFNPEGDSYMKYRDQKDEEDRDAEE